MALLARTASTPVMVDLGLESPVSGIVTTVQGRCGFLDPVGVRWVSIKDHQTA